MPLSIKIMLYSHNGMLYSNESKLFATILNSVGEFQKLNIEQKKPRHQKHTCDWKTGKTNY